ncbi:hypothetical protein GGX14DRAFT_607447, partial [Mycena pura]
MHTQRRLENQASRLRLCHPFLAQPLYYCSARRRQDTQSEVQIASWVEVDAQIDIWRKDDGARLLEGADWREAKQEGDGAMIRCASLPLPPYTAHSSRHSWLPEDEDNIALLFKGIHRGRSIVPPHAVPARPMAMRWRSKTSPS